VPLNSFLFSPLPAAGEGRVRGFLKIFSFLSSLPLRERTKVRGAVKFFSSSFFPLFPVGEGKGGGAFIFYFSLNPAGIFAIQSRDKVKLIFKLKNL
jgi:hypothetical protein